MLPGLGKGKGAVDHWVAVVRPGRIIFEVAGLDQATSLEAMRLASHKLALKTKVVIRRDIAQVAARAGAEAAEKPE